MRLFVSSRPALPVALAVLLLLPGGPSRAQEAPGPGPGVIDPRGPEGDAPGGPADRGPMIVPAPDEDAPEAPETFGSGAVPAEPGAAAPPAVAEADGATREERLDRLFAELKRQFTVASASEVASRIEQEWVHSGSATVDLLMSRAASSMAKNANAAALDLLDQVLVLEPGFAEAWNRRATLHFAMDAYGKSLADIEQTLAREPRHFGALMGLALILERTEQKEKALEVYLRVLEVYPMLRSAQDAAGRLADELTGPDI